MWTSKLANRTKYDKQRHMLKLLYLAPGPLVMLVHAILSHLKVWVLGGKHILIFPSKVGFLQTKATGCHEYITYKKSQKAKATK